MFRFSIFFFFNDTATTEIYTLSLHDALPIYRDPRREDGGEEQRGEDRGEPLHRVDQAHERLVEPAPRVSAQRSEEHTSELQSRLHLVCRLLLEKKKKTRIRYMLQSGL